MAAEHPDGVPIWPVILAFLGLAQFSLGAALAWLWARASVLEARIDVNAQQGRDALDKRVGELWEGVHVATKKADDTHIEMLTALREVPTKQDLSAMEDRLSAVIRRGGSHGHD